MNNQQCGPDMIYCGGLGDPNNEWEVMEYQYAGGEITGEEYYAWLVDNGSFTIPSEYSLFTYGGQYTKRENYQTMDFNISWYREIRQKLFVDFGWIYIDITGKIKDEALIAIIIMGEFGTTISNNPDVYDVYQAALKCFIKFISFNPKRRNYCSFYMLWLLYNSRAVNIYAINAGYKNHIYR